MLMMMKKNVGKKQASTVTEDVRVVIMVSKVSVFIEVFVNEVTVQILIPGVGVSIKFI